MNKDRIGGLSRWLVVCMMGWGSFGLESSGLGNFATAQILGVPDDRMILRLLSSTNEPTRIRGIGLIAAHPRTKYDQLDVIIAGTENQIRRLKPNMTPDASTVSLLYTIGSTRRDAANEFSAGLLDGDNPEIVMLTADVLGKEQAAAAVEKISNLSDHPAFATSYAFRFNIVRALFSLDTPEAMNRLSDIRESMDGQLRVDMDRMFDQIGVNSFGGDQQQFENWRRKSNLSLSVNPASAKTDSATDQSPPIAGGANGSTGNATHPAGGLGDLPIEAPEFYGIKVEAKRMLFILDHSGSMREYDGNMTRLDRAKEELIYTIERLPPADEFAIMIYANKTRIWRPELSVANRANKAAAITWIRRIGYGDRTNTHTALVESLTFDPSLEAVYLLSDGKPTLGSIVQTRPLVADVLHRNTFRHLRFHTIGISVSGNTLQFLRQLAEGSNGEFREIH